MDELAVALTHPRLLSDPFLQFPDDISVSVVWFTDFRGSGNVVEYGDNLAQTQEAVTKPLSRMREDRESWVGTQNGNGSVHRLPVWRGVWRHEARVPALSSDKRIPYRVVSRGEDNQLLSSRVFSLSPRPERYKHVRMLLTSDHQVFPAAAVNMEKAAQIAGHLDAVLYAGDLVNVCDRASEWFDDNRGTAFFPILQGNARVRMNHDSAGEVYQGGEIIQHTPLYPVIGNHDAMGRLSMLNSLRIQSLDTRPQSEAQEQYEKLYGVLLNPEGATSFRRQWIEDNSFNTVTFGEIFSLPRDANEDGRYYSQRIGDAFLIALCVARTWRTPSFEPDQDVRGAYHEVDVCNPATWGYGAHIFESVAVGSLQYNWLIGQLKSADFKTARCKIVMLHHSFHSLGLDIVPPYCDPQQTIERDRLGAATHIRYKYPVEHDYLARDLGPLLEEAGVDVVLSGHNHLWNRFVGPNGVNYLENSSVGNTHGAYWLDNKRGNIPSECLEQYASVGDPNGLHPVGPNIHPLANTMGESLPYVAENHLSTFSILDTGNGTVSSYYVDTRQPSLGAVKFDEFSFV